MPQTIQYHRFGGPEVLTLEETPPQRIGSQEVIIAVHAAGLNPIDYKIVVGDQKIKMLERIQRIQHPHQWFSGSRIFPRGVGRDFSGTILQIGKDVTEFSLHDRVFGTLRSAPGLGKPQGSLTTELITSVDNITLTPPEINDVTASTLGVAAQTVCGAFRALEIEPSDTLVISAASGGMGSLATQLAVARGAKVIGIAGPGHQSYIQSLGATAVSYSSGRNIMVEQIRRHKPTKFLDCFGGPYVDIALQAGLPARHVGTLVPSPLSLLRGAKFTGSRHGTSADLQTVAALIATGKIDIRVEEVFPFTKEGVQRGYSVLAQGHAGGKLVIDLSINH